MSGILYEFSRTPTVDDFKKLLQDINTQFNSKRASEGVNKSLIMSQGHTLQPQKNPIVFLDFDGVCWPQEDIRKTCRELCSDLVIQKLLESYRSMIAENYGIIEEDDSGDILAGEFIYAVCWDPEHMRRIRELCESHNARIVVTSAWRNGRTVQQLKNILDLWGLGHFVIGKTEDGETLLSKREIQIQKWLDDNKHITRGYVVLDDQHVQALKNQFGDKFIHCDPLEGFDKRAFNKANAALTAQKEFVQQESNLNIVLSSPFRLAN